MADFFFMVAVIFGFGLLMCVVDFIGRVFWPNPKPLPWEEAEREKFNQE